MRLALALLLVAADFRDVARESGLVHVVPNGGDRAKKFILETTGSGAALVDIDNDGLLDAFLVSGDGAPSRFYRNTGGGRFRDAGVEAGFTRTGWGQGVCAGDFDNDGYTDLAVTYWGALILYRNLAGRRFAEMELKQTRVRYNTGCAFLDYDNDGDLDLFVANYLKFDFETTPQPGANPYCFYRGLPVACGPRGLPFDRNLLYRNNGNRSFTDVSETSGIARPFGHYALGVVTGDFNGDGFVDLYVACDQTPSLRYINRGDGTFAEDAVLRGVAFDENGRATSGMGAAAADYDGDGLVDIFRTNFSDERATLYRNRGAGEFDETTTAAGLGHNTRFVGWGCGFFDFDLDGWKDLLLVNGHVFPEVDGLGLDIRFRDRAILYRNLGNGRFADVSETSGEAIRARHASRGAAFGDIDNDGRVEVLVNHQNEAPSLLRETGRRAGNWIAVKLEGSRSNRSAVGAKVRVTAGGRTQTAEVRSGGSYLSQDDLRLAFGLGGATRIERIEIEWPRGGRRTLQNTPANQILTIRE
ncbi:MAG: CRTAC1 family protein [Bryobacteraceae bacterium]